MDSSSYTERLRNRTLFFWNQLSSAEKKSPQTYDTLIETVSGGMPAFVNYRVADVDFLPTTTIESEQYTLDEAILLCLDAVLRYAATNNLGPTKTSRLFYLWFFTIATGYHWVSTTTKVSGTKDTWNWDTKYVLPNQSDQFVWMNHILIDVMPSFVPTFNTSLLLQKEAKALGLTPEQQTVKVNDVQTHSHYTEWKSAWDTWWSYRQSDGNVAASAVPSDSLLPNGSQTLEVTTTNDDPNNFTEPNKWVPLKINGSKKNYLTYGWNDVTSSCLTTDQETTLKAVAQTYFPGTATSWDDGSTRANEILDLVNLTNNLTDEQKVIAEFWAGGPFTVSPPGMMIWLWAKYMICEKIAHKSGYDAFFFSGLDLAINLFEVGRLVWGLKKDNIQARPIQEIRRMYRAKVVTKYDGTVIQGTQWVPYQTTNFVTPPFADFPSGHSAFSQSFANVMSKWFSSFIETKPTTLQDLSLMSPIFTAWQTNSFGTFIIPKGSSEIQPSTVPSQDITLAWSSWQDMANSSGLSRQYGGIHCNSAHTGSQALANELHTVLNNNWGF